MNKTYIAQLSRGFTLIELMVTVTMVAVIISLTSVNLTGLISTTSHSEALELFISDAKRQQLRAMAGERQNNTSSFGIYFEADTYVLFVGSSYNPNASTNVRISLPRGVVFENITLPSETVVFSPSSGAILNYDSNTDRVTLRNTTSNEASTLEFNSLGVITVL